MWMLRIVEGFTGVNGSRVIVRDVIERRIDGKPARLPLRQRGMMRQLRQDWSLRRELRWSLKWLRQTLAHAFRRR